MFALLARARWTPVVTHPQLVLHPPLSLHPFDAHMGRLRFRQGQPDRGQYTIHELNHFLNVCHGPFTHHEVIHEGG